MFELPMKIDCHIEDICNICMKKTVSQKRKWGASSNAQYIHPHAGIRSEGDVGRV